jgi:ribosomal protein S18 acetylase RimI-like enzyme
VLQDRRYGTRSDDALGSPLAHLSGAVPFHAEDLTVEIRVLKPEEVEQVGNALGLARLYQGNGFYLVAWCGDEPAGHLHLALTDPPELQDVQVAAGHRRRGVAKMLIAAAEREARARGFTRIRVDVAIDNDPAQALYRTSGFSDIGLDPRPVKGTIVIRTGPIEVDDVLITWEKDLTEALGPRLPDGA